MKLRSMLLAGVLGAAVLFLAGSRSEAAVGGPDPVSRSAPDEVRVSEVPQAGTPAEVQDYVLREEQSPEVQEFSGGAVVLVSAGFVVLVLLVIVIIILLGD